MKAGPFLLLVVLRGAVVVVWPGPVYQIRHALLHRLLRRAAVLGARPLAGLFPVSQRLTELGPFLRRRRLVVDRDVGPLPFSVSAAGHTARLSRNRADAGTAPRNRLRMVVISCRNCLWIGRTWPRGAATRQRAATTAATIRADRSRGRWPAPDDSEGGANRWCGATATRALEGRRGYWRTAGGGDAS
ncbi:hypothetical protein RB628_37725 [Streptomyces sp. ADMS]|uniref:hypothetical protein n=1 Tax=Streptomyces sp. ADMS TaxID=3071415 RepID=UPI00296E8ECB|nr:hypothetical protein [Streptomyces sp. ADMS]MDW4910905.1 hypothetical protein [Streptomyces sp. ADMS]